MSASLFYFVAMVLLSIAYVYNHFVVIPKLNALNNAHQFRYVRNLNTELINLFNLYSADLQNCMFDGSTYDTMMGKLQILRSNVYTTDTFKQLVGKQKVKRRHINALHASIYQQIQMQQQLKATLNNMMCRYKNKMAA